MGRLAGPGTAAVVKNLGIDFASGMARNARGSGATRWGRLAASWQRAARIRRLVQAGAAGQRMARPTLTAANLYGTDVEGMPGATLRAARAQVASVTPPLAKGRVNTLVLAIEHDPAFLADSGPVVRWARAVWLHTANLYPAGWPNFIELAKSFVAEKHSAEAKPGWLASRGPMGALVRTLARIGWRARTALDFTTDRGELLSFKTSTPLAIKAEVGRSTHRRLVRRLRLKDADGPIEEINLAPVRGLMDKRSKLSPQVKAKARTLFCGGAWTGERAFREGVTPTRRPCPLCGGVDTLFHRIWWCINLEDRRRKAVKQELLDRALMTNTDDLLFTRGIAPLRTQGVAPPRSDDAFAWYPHPPPQGVSQTMWSSSLTAAPTASRCRPSPELDGRSWRSGPAPVSCSMRLMGTSPRGGPSRPVSASCWPWRGR